METLRLDPDRYLTATGSASANNLLTTYLAIGGQQKAAEAAEIAQAIDALSPQRRNQLRHLLEHTDEVPSGYGIPEGAPVRVTLALAVSFTQDDERKGRRATERKQAGLALWVAWIGPGGSVGAAALALIAGLIWGGGL